MVTVNKIAELLYKKFNLLSVFLYGSRSTNTTNSKSDIEIGIVFNDEEYVSRKEIKESFSDSNCVVYPFRKSDLQNCSIDTPFQKTIFINSLVLSAKTLIGEKVIESIKPPEITALDLLLDIRFNLGYALASIQSFKFGSIELANELFYKSCFYATRNLICSKFNKLEISYEAIFKASQQFKFSDEHKELIETAYKLRKQKLNKIDENLYYKNISYLNYIEIELKKLMS